MTLGAESRLDRAAWLERCSAALLRRDPLIGEADCKDLAADLWHLIENRYLSPEDAVDRLFGDQVPLTR